VAGTQGFNGFSVENAATSLANDHVCANKWQADAKEHICGVGK
jgi:hypothetical protein